MSEKSNNTTSSEKLDFQEDEIWHQHNFDKKKIEETEIFLCDIELMNDEIQMLQVRNQDLKKELTDKETQNKLKIEELEHKLNEVTSENSHLRRLVDEAENKKIEPQVPFEVSSGDSISVDMTKLEQMKKEFEKEKEQLRQQRSQAEEKCINMKIESFKYQERISELEDEVANQKEVQAYYEELVKQKSKECNDIRTELKAI